MGSAKDILIEIIRQAGGVFEGKTRLYKVFYFAHLFYFELSDGRILSEHPIVQMPEGPGIDRGDQLLRELKREKRIQVDSRQTGPYSEMIYRLIGDQPTSLDREARSAIKEACTYVVGRSAQDLSAITHEFSHAWRIASSGEELNIYQDTLSDDQREMQRQQIDEARKAITAALHGPQN